MKSALSNCIKHIILGLGLSALLASAQAYENHSQRPHELQLLNQGLAALYKRLELIDRAEKSILLETFIFRDDEVGRILTKRLLEKVNQGVEVKVLVDNLGTVDDPMAAHVLDLFHVHEMRKAGIEVKVYNTVPMIQFAKFNHRDHRKLMVVDGKYAIVGGRNIENAYYDLPNDEKLYFTDREVAVTGELAYAMEQNFRDVWSNEFAVIPEDRPHRPKPNDLIYLRGNQGTQRVQNRENYRRDLHQWILKAAKAEHFIEGHATDQAMENSIYQAGPGYLAQEQVGTCADLTFVSSRPHNYKDMEINLVHRSIIEEFAKAQQELIIENPYFILDKPMEASVRDTLDRGVKLKILTNSMFSETELAVAMRSYKFLKDTVERGNVELFVHPKDMQHPYDLPEHLRTSDHQHVVHAKSFVYDQSSFFIGSYNMDPRSAFLSLEMGLYCRQSPELAQAVKADIIKRTNVSLQLKNSDEINANRFEYQGLKTILKYYMLFIPAIFAEQYL